MKKRFFIVSDIEMGKRDLMDDFSDDHVFAHFIQTILEKSKKDEEVFLILNGDIFDFMKMDYKGAHTRYITEAVSSWKLDQVLESHQLVFKALRHFLQHENKNVFFVIGNHDFDLIWPALQEKIRNHLGKSKRVDFAYSFEYEKLHVEHGNLQDPFYKNDVKRPFTSYKGQKLLNLPVGSYVFFSELAHFKRKFAKEEQFYPRERIEEFFPEYGKAINGIKKRYFWKALTEPFIHFDDPTYRIDIRPFFKHVLKFGLDFINDERFLPSRLTSMMKRFPHKRFFVSGHAHLFKNITFKDKRFFITDTWRNEYHLLKKGNPKKEKSYAELEFEGSYLHNAQLHVFAFDDGVKMERAVDGEVIGQKIRAPGATELLRTRA